jgi:hypothetical protein
MSDLRMLHDELLQMLDELEGLTARAAPDEAAIAAVRYRLTRTSGARRRLVEALCLELQLAVPESAAAALEELHAATAAATVMSADHISRWSLREIMKDWQGYCRASEVMRAAIRGQVAEEKRVLYPLL